MSQIGAIERETQNQLVQLFQGGLNYEYLGNWQDRPSNSNIEEDILRKYLLKAGYSEALITRAIFTLNKTAGDQSKSLYDVNKEVYGLLRYGIKEKESVGDQKTNIWLIDWENPNNNHFAIAEEVSITGDHSKRPDIVVYVNGIALAIIELKRSTISVSEGIRQNITNQKKEYIQHFFSTIQFTMAGNNAEGLRYGTIETPEKYYLNWKEENPDSNEPQYTLTEHILQLFNKQRFLELMHDFIIYDMGIKKICRHNQYFGVKAAQRKIKKQEGGIIWHTQGSGKSLTMVWLAKWVRENMDNARVLIITDREELDDQIEKVFKGVQEKIVRCTSGKDLINRLNHAEDQLLCSLIHKFGRKNDADYEGYIDDILKHLPKDFKVKGNLYIFVDECHRTQSGTLHQAMKKIVPDALYIGFTGTPLLKKDKKRSIEIFGSYIHVYKFDEAVKDEVVLDLQYEARDIDQTISSPDKIDQWFAAKTKGLNDYALTQLKKRWGTLQKVLSSQSRLEKIVADILLDMETKDRLSNGRGNAMLVAGSIYQACKLYELFIDKGFDRCAIVTSYVPSHASIRTESTGEGETEKLDQFKIYERMLNGKDTETLEKEVKKKFIEEPGQMRLLIVVDKLLTGFDAPPATYLYIDKKMRDHALFQAICRVNRLHGEDKEFGYIIDYKDLFHNIENSMHDYTSGALDAYDKEDVEGLLTDRLEKAKDRLENSRETIKALCEPVAPPKAELDYLHYFCSKNTQNADELKDNEPKRIELYKQTSSLVRAFANIANEYDKLGYSKNEFETLREEVKFYENLRATIKWASGDYIDLKTYEPAMRHLIDSYIRADDSIQISAFDDISLVKLLANKGTEAVNDLPENIRKNKEAVAEAIENNQRKIIVNEQPINPKYYEKMSTLLDQLIQQRKAGAIEYQDYLTQIAELSKKILNPSGENRYPKSMNTEAKQALFDNLDQNENLALALDLEICNNKKDSWRGNRIKEREVIAAIRKHINEEDVERIFDLVKNQKDY